MAKKLVKRDERVVRFFGKWRKLDRNGAFKVGRMRVIVLLETGGSSFWGAMLIGYNDDATIEIGGARSRAAALKQLERRLEMLRRTLNTICEDAGPLRGWNR